MLLRCMIWEVHPGDCGWATLGAGLRGDVILGTLVMRPQVHSLEVVSSWRLFVCDPRCRVWEVGHPLDSRHVTPGTGSGGGVTLGTVDMGQGPRSGEQSHQGDWMCDHTDRLWEDVTLMNVDL